MRNLIFVLVFFAASISAYADFAENSQMSDVVLDGSAHGDILKKWGPISASSSSFIAPNDGDYIVDVTLSPSCKKKKCRYHAPCERYKCWFVYTDGSYSVSVNNRAGEVFYSNREGTLNDTKILSLIKGDKVDVLFDAAGSAGECQLLSEASLYSAAG